MVVVSAAAAGRCAVVGSAPCIGGSTDGSAWDLIFGYNGFGRLFGEGGGGGGASFGGAAGWLRMFNTQVGGQIAWLLPAGGRSRSSRASPRAASRAPTGAARCSCSSAVWALVHFVIFSRQEGTFHPTT